MLSQSSVIEMMQNHQIIPANTSIEEAITHLQDPKSHCLIVIDPNGALAGIFTEEDLVNKILGKNLLGSEPIIDFTDPEPLSLGEDCDFSDVLTMMAEKALRYVPVCDKENKPKGLFSIRELIYCLASNIELIDSKVVLKSTSPKNILGKYQEEIITVLNLPINFALSSFGISNAVKVSADESIEHALSKFKGTGVVSGLVFKDNEIKGFLKLRDIPFKCLGGKTNLDEINVSEFIAPLPHTLKEQDSIGEGISLMQKDSSLFLHYKVNENSDGIITARGILAYMYAHIYDDE